MSSVYIGLLREDLTEPSKSTGYQRTYLGELEEIDLQKILMENQVVFPDVLFPGYGVIHFAALYLTGIGGQALDCFEFMDKYDIHEGVVPVIHKGKLWRGMDTKVTLNIQNDIITKMGGSIW